MDWDHPRSRGVYRAARPPGTGFWGSSPLARGLLQGVVDAHERVRIIPARAGFTAFFVAVNNRVQDHPRSRGVYHSSCISSRIGSGSSPLARGLHGEDGED